VSLSDSEIRFSTSRSRPYFFNASTQQSVWEAPAELTEDQINNLPGAEHLTYSGQSAPAPATSSNGKVSHWLGAAGLSELVC
jgi:NIMA-interacting peptidyl-prolyl cis-trans isomerase 1